MASKHKYLILTLVSTATSTISCGFELLPHTIFLNNYKKIVQKYR